MQVAAYGPVSLESFFRMLADDAGAARTKHGDDVPVRLWEESATEKVALPMRIRRNLGSLPQAHNNRRHKGSSLGQSSGNNGTARQRIARRRMSF